MADGISITIRGEQAIIDRLRQWPSAMERVLLQVGALYEAEVKKQLSMAGVSARQAGISLGRRGSGRWLDKNPTDHLRVGTGQLRSSITHALTQSLGGVYAVVIGTNVVYGRIHELGAPPGGWKAWGRIARTAFPARPYMKPVADDDAISLRVAGMIGSRLVAVVQGGST